MAFGERFVEGCNESGLASDGEVSPRSNAKNRIEAIQFEKDRLADRYEAVINSMAEGVVYQAVDGTVVAANPAAERILGLTMAQLCSRTSQSPGWQAIREGGAPFPGEDHPAMVTLRTGQPQSDIVMGVRRPDGSRGNSRSSVSHLSGRCACARAIVTGRGHGKPHHDRCPADNQGRAHQRLAGDL